MRIPTSSRPYEERFGKGLPQADEAPSLRTHQGELLMPSSNSPQEINFDLFSGQAD